MDFDQPLVTTPTIQQKDTTLTKIFVGGLPYHTNDKSLRQFFETFGDIEEAVVITDRQTGKSRGYGFVTMSDKEAAERAVKEPNPIIDGRKANVNLAYLGAKVRPNVQNGKCNYNARKKKTKVENLEHQNTQINKTSVNDQKSKERKEVKYKIESQNDKMCPFNSSGTKEFNFACLVENQTGMMHTFATPEVAEAEFPYQFETQNGMAGPTYPAETRVEFSYQYANINGMADPFHPAETRVEFSYQFDQNGMIHSYVPEQGGISYEFENQNARACGIFNASETQEIRSHYQNQIQRLNGFPHLRTPTFPFMIPSQYRTSPSLQYDNGEYVYISLPSQYVYHHPSAAYLPAPGLILSNPTPTHAPLSTAAAAGGQLYTEYATAYAPPPYTNGLEIGYTPFPAAPLAATSGTHHHLTNGTTALPSYLPPATHSPAAYAYTLPAPPHHQPIPTGAPAHFPVPYPAPPQEPRMP